MMQSDFIIYRYALFMWLEMMINIFQLSICQSVINTCYKYLLSLLLKECIIHVLASHVLFCKTYCECKMYILQTSVNSTFCIQHLGRFDWSSLLSKQLQTLQRQSLYIVADLLDQSNSQNTFDGQIVARYKKCSENESHKQLRNVVRKWGQKCSDCCSVNIGLVTLNASTFSRILQLH